MPFLVCVGDRCLHLSLCPSCTPMPLPPATRISLSQAVNPVPSQLLLLPRAGYAHSNPQNCTPSSTPFGSSSCVRTHTPASLWIMPHHITQFSRAGYRVGALTAYASYAASIASVPQRNFNFNSLWFARNTMLQTLSVGFLSSALSRL